MIFSEDRNTEMKYFASYFYNEEYILCNWLEIPSVTHSYPCTSQENTAIALLGHSKSRSWPSSPYQKQETVESELSLSLSSPCVAASMVKGSSVESRGACQTLWGWPSPQMSLQCTTSWGNRAASGRARAPGTFKGPSAHTFAEAQYTKLAL